MLPRLVAVWVLLFAPPDTFVLRALHIRGNKVLSEQRIISVTGLAVNRRVGKDDLDAAKDKLIATGMFETVAFQFEPGPDGQCCIANYDVAEITALFPVQFENLPEPAADIEGYLRNKIPLYNPTLPGTQQVIDFYARQIEVFLATRNHAGKILGALVKTGKNEYKITFRTDEALPAVSGVVFTGNKAITSTTLQNKINDVAFGQPFTQDGFRLMLETQAKPLYDALGMIRVKFSNFTLEPDPRVKGVIVHVTVEEGGVYKLAKVSVSGADREYVYTSGIRTGGIVNFDEVNQGLEKVLAQLRKEGYMHVEGDVDRKIDDAAKTVSVNLNIEKGVQYRFGKLTIEGLDLNGEPAVRKIWGVAEGKPYNALYPQYFLDRIREDGMFDHLGATKAIPAINETTHVVDVTLQFGAAVKNAPEKRPGPIR